MLASVLIRILFIYFNTEIFKSRKLCRLCRIQLPNLHIDQQFIEHLTQTDALLCSLEIREQVLIHCSHESCMYSYAHHCWRGSDVDFIKMVMPFVTFLLTISILFFFFFFFVFSLSLSLSLNNISFALFFDILFTSFECLERWSHNKGPNTHNNSNTWFPPFCSWKP